MSGFDLRKHRSKTVVWFRGFVLAQHTPTHTQRYSPLPPYTKTDVHTRTSMRYVTRTHGLAHMHRCPHPGVSPYIYKYKKKYLVHTTHTTHNTTRNRTSNGLCSCVSVVVCMGVHTTTEHTTTPGRLEIGVSYTAMPTAWARSSYIQRPGGRLYYSVTHSITSVT